MNTQFSCMTYRGRFAAEYEAAPPWFRTLFTQIVKAYAMSADTAPIIDAKGLSPEVAGLIAGYMQAQIKGTVRSVGAVDERVFNDTPIPLSPHRVVQTFTGGKDSLHSLIRAVETYGADNVLALYVDRLNKSECLYEKAAVPDLAAQLGVRSVVVSTSNSIKINRTGHHIGLREQMVVALAIPHMIAFNAGVIHFGNTLEQSVSELWTDTPAAWGLFTDWLKNRFGLVIEVRKHVDFPGMSEVQIMENLIKTRRKLFMQITSCYTQQNFRENRHKALKSKIPSIEIYKGCGSCLKCCRINGALLLYDAVLDKNARREDVIFLANHITNRWKKQFGRDRYLTAICEDIQRKYRNGQDQNNPQENGSSTGPEEEKSLNLQV